MSGDAFFYDDFTRYSSTSDLKAVMGHSLGGTGGASAIYDDGLNGNLLEIDPSVKYNGHPTLKYNQPGGTVNTPQVTSYLPHTVTKMWLRVKIRYSPGFTTYGVTPNVAKAYKLLGWGWQGIDRSARIEFTNTNDYVFVWAAMSRDGTSVVGGTPDKLSGKAGSEWSDGGWYDYIVYYEQTSPTTVRQRWWLARDGQTPILRADQTGSMSAGTVAPVDRIMLGMNFNSQRPANQSQALWIAQWEVVDGSQYSNPFNVF